ncbi:hypothetical protein SLEP1_g30936 [Rubroshorea leprosula]|uniref:FAD-binding domain-containing protein n=1 Tax=Rubroshorea leprosula TaxID=152421 RepID=A0AAV5K1W7_9ROSI|nr:hypothetical protein SLEP1_g30936 [Rubroshorea leprosula]
MDIVEDIVIAGAGLAGLTTALGLHRLGIRSLVLEASNRLRTTGFAFLSWNNAWKALDAVGVGETLRQQHKQFQSFGGYSLVSGKINSELLFKEHEVRCLKRQLLVEALEKELPSGTIRYSSKVVSIEESGHFKLVHLADGTIIKTKVLIGCDGVNSVVAKWLGFDPPVFTGRSAIRAYADLKGGHGLGPKISMFFGNDIRTGYLPCDDQTVYWFLAYNASSNQDKELEENPAKLKQFALSKIGNLPDKLKSVVEGTQLDSIITSPLRYRRPWDLLWGNISKGNVCVAGDALHPMTPDIGQGGCAALEDGVVLSRCLAEALSKSGEEEWKRIEMGLEKYSRERRWRSIELISTAYASGAIQNRGSGKIMNFLRDKFLNKFFLGLMLGRASFDCGKLSVS